MKICVLTGFILLLFTTAGAQILRYAASNPYISVSGYSTLQRDVFSFTANQAALARMEEPAVGIFGERRFMIAENSSYAAAAVLPLKPGNFGLQLNYAGFGSFNESKIGIAYGKSLGEVVDVGVQFNHINYQMRQYGSLSAINFEGGLLLHITPQFIAGVYTFNPIGGRMGKGGEEKIAGIYKLGFGYDVSDQFFAGLDIVKEENQPVNVSGGMQYQFMRKFFARAGFRSDNATFFGGAGIALGSLRLDVGSSYHQQLGFSPSIMLISAFHNRKGDE